MLTNYKFAQIVKTNIVENKNEENSFHDREITHLILIKDSKGPIKQGFGSLRWYLAIIIQFSNKIGKK